MGYITNKERAWRVRSSNQSYLLRKILIATTVAFLVILVIFAIVTVANVTSAMGEHQHEPDAFTLIEAMCAVPLSLFKCWRETPAAGGEIMHVTLSGFGWFMAVWAVITLALSVASLVLMLLMKSPKAAKKNINVLEGAALSGKKLAAHANASEVYRQRATNPKKLKKMEARKHKK